MNVIDNTSEEFKKILPLVKHLRNNFNSTIKNVLRDNDNQFNLTDIEKANVINNELIQQISKLIAMGSGDGTREEQLLIAQELIKEISIGLKLRTEDMIDDHLKIKKRSQSIRDLLKDLLDKFE